MNKLQDTRKLKVIVRFRPLFQKQIEQGNQTCIQAIENNTIKLKQSPHLPKLMNTRFSFDKIFDQTATQKDIHNVIGKNTINCLFQGINVTIISYGQTSSGKTYTCIGSNLIKQQKRGVFPRIIEDIFNQIKESSSSIQFRLKVSAVQIYMQKIRDLLQSKKLDLKIRQSKSKGIYIQNATERYASSQQQLLEYLQQANTSRFSQSQNNSISSKSHMIFTLTLSQTNLRQMDAKFAKLTIVDLAGSQKVGKHNNDVKIIEQTKKVNKGLSSLGNVIYALTQTKIIHVPYRDSKLTRILQQSLGGNARTILIINCIPSMVNQWQTINSLRFGFRAKNIRNQPIINKQFTVTELLVLLQRAQKKINFQQRLIKQLRIGGATSLKIIQYNTFQQEDGMMSSRSNRSSNRENSIYSKKSIESDIDNDLEQINEKIFLDGQRKMMQKKIESLLSNIQDLKYEKVIMKREQQVLNDKYNKLKLINIDLKEKIVTLEKQNEKLIQQSLKFEFQYKQLQECVKQYDQKIKTYQHGLQNMINQANNIKNQTAKLNIFFNNPEKIQSTCSIIRTASLKSQIILKKQLYQKHRTESILSTQSIKKFLPLQSQLCYSQKSFNQQLHKKNLELSQLNQNIKNISNKKNALQQILNMTQQHKTKRILSLQTYLVELSTSFYILKSQQHMWQTNSNINDNQIKRKNERIKYLQEELSKSKQVLYKLKLRYESLANRKSKDFDILDIELTENIEQNRQNKQAKIVKILKSSCRKLNDLILE